MEVLDSIKNLLDEANAEYKLYEHEPVRTSEEAAKVRGSHISIGAKALVLFADKTPILVVVPGDKKLDLRKFKQLFKIKDLRMATHEEVLMLTSVEVGAVPPLGKALKLASYFDNSFKQKDIVAFNAGKHTVSIIMNAVDLLKIENPTLGDFTC